MSVNGVELSPGLRSLVPGQRRLWLMVKPGSSVGSFGALKSGSRPPLTDGEKELNVVWIRAMPPLAS